MLDHLRQQPVGELPVAREVERHRLLPLRLARFEREAPAAAGVIDEDVDAPERGERRIGDALRRIGGEEVLLDDRERCAGFLFELLQQISAAGDHSQLDALPGKGNGNGAADADARACDQRAFAGEREVHESRPATA